MLDNIKIVKFLCWQFEIIVDSKQIFNIVDCNKKYCDKMEKNCWGFYRDCRFIF